MKLEFGYELNNSKKLEKNETNEKRNDCVIREEASCESHNKAKGKSITKHMFCKTCSTCKTYIFLDFQLNEGFYRIWFVK